MKVIKGKIRDKTLKNIQDLRYDQKADFRDIPKARKKVYQDADGRKVLYHDVVKEEGRSNFTDKTPMVKQKRDSGTGMSNLLVNRVRIQRPDLVGRRMINKPLDTPQKLERPNKPASKPASKRKPPLVTKTSKAKKKKK